MTSTATCRDIPAELIFSILEYVFIDTPSCAQITPLLLISKSVYNWVIPKLYRTLWLDSEKTISYNVDPTRLLGSANPSSLLHVRRIISAHWRAEPDQKSFSPFANLTHFFLMSVPAVLPPDTSGIPNLPLEELIILNPVDRNLLFGSLSPDSTICQTLQRFCSYDFWTDQDDIKGFDLCRNLNHVLLWARNHSFLYFRMYPVSLFLRRASFVCWLVIPISGSDQSRMFDRAREVFQPLKDRRIVLAKAFHDIKRTVYGPSNFWDGQADLWKAGTDAVAQNEQLEAVTIVDRMTR